MGEELSQVAEQQTTTTEPAAAPVPIPAMPTDRSPENVVKEFHRVRDDMQRRYGESETAYGKRLDELEKKLSPLLDAYSAAEAEQKRMAGLDPQDPLFSIHKELRELREESVATRKEAHERHEATVQEKAETAQKAQALEQIVGGFSEAMRAVGLPGDQATIKIIRDEVSRRLAGQIPDGPEGVKMVLFALPHLIQAIAYEKSMGKFAAKANADAVKLTTDAKAAGAVQASGKPAPKAGTLTKEQMKELSSAAFYRRTGPL